MAEIFKPIVGYEGRYEISNRGNVKSLARAYFHSGKPQFYPEKILKIEKTYKGYQRVMLAKDGHHKKWYIHRLVALTFIPNTENKEIINHKNGRKFDNRVSNLEWCTTQENTAHYYNSKK